MSLMKNFSMTESSKPCNCNQFTTMLGDQLEISSWLSISIGTTGAGGGGGGMGVLSGTGVSLLSHSSLEVGK
jgi:hypothetical protein